VDEAGVSKPLGRRNRPILGELPHLTWSTGAARYHSEGENAARPA